MAFIDDQGKRYLPPAPTPTTTNSAPATAPSGQRPIPYAGIYLEQQALAQQAYEAALAQLNEQQTSLFNRFGLRMNNGKTEVDPLNQFGEYQQLRRQQATELDDIEANTRGRGLFGGVAGQALNPARYAHGIQNLGLSNSFLDAFKGIQSQRNEALITKNRALMEAERDQLYNAIDNEDYTPPATSAIEEAQQRLTRSVVQKPAAKKRVEPAWQRALRLRSQAMQRRPQTYAGRRR